MTFGGPRAPPGRPVVTQAAIALPRRLIRRKEGHTYLLALQHLGDHRGNLHMARIPGEIQRLFTVILACSAYLESASSYQNESKRLPGHHKRRQRGACCSVHTPCGDLPTGICRTTFFSSVSMTVSLRAQRELT